MAGVLFAMTVIVEMSLQRITTTSRIQPGMSLSIVLMSLEKRLTTRPTGVVSKKDIGARRTFMSS